MPEVIQTKSPEEVLHYWFGEIEDGYPVSNRYKLWFSGAPEVDEEIREEFQQTVELATGGELSHWENSPHSLLALVITLDQFTRSLYRKTPAAFSGDFQARKLTLDAIQKGWDHKLAYTERSFLYMPLMHSEELSDQELCVTKFEELYQEVSEEHKEKVKNSLHYAKDHRDIIERFGRFPHRNKTLGRTNTDEETEYLEGGASSYGQ
ncbi:DUF924 family protein [Sansalvadorimonas verongulae]|uniref:DUF924 family protein n=1 Tax=Sansalvadorimonas verongulae TaxID=2172824 RepID=UPI0018AD15B1|nr:DUF924 family protein [Sansalvadorimonas verongulae]